MLRGGWGAYRFVTQVNDVSPPLVTAQDVLSYSLPGQKTIQLSQLGQLAYKPCLSQCVNGGQAGFDPGDYSQPLTYAYNLTIDQRLKWNTMLDIAYVGSNTTSSPTTAKVLKAATSPHSPIRTKPRSEPSSNPTRSPAYNPPIRKIWERILSAPTGTPTGNKVQDYRPYGYAYSTNAVAMIQGTAYTNYNGLQVAWIKTTGKLGYNLNFTWSRTLGTGLQDESL